MKSLSELTEQLTGIRLAAVDTSLWSMTATLAERARLAINDAIAVHKYHYNEIEHTIQLPYGASIIAIPPNAERVVSVGVWDASMSAMVNVTDIEHLPTPQTNMVRVKVSPPLNNAPRWLQVEYEARIQELPPTASLQQNISPFGGTQIIVAYPYKVKSEWPETGYACIEAMVTTQAGHRELVHYGAVTASQGFLCDVRGLGGTPICSWAVNSSVTISPVLVAPPEIVPVIMAEAEANMYHYWVGHRAQYDQYIAVAGIQAMDVQELEGLVRTLEARADRRSRRVRKAPKVGKASVRYMREQ